MMGKTHSANAWISIERCQSATTHTRFIKENERSFFIFRAGQSQGEKKMQHRAAAEDTNRYMRINQQIHAEQITDVQLVCTVLLSFT